MSAIHQISWLLIFYSVPSKPVSNRMKIWRKLAKAGAVQLKGSVYILPDSDEHYEFFEWLTSEVKTMGGDGAFVKAGKIETLKQKDVIALFNHQREKEYGNLENRFEGFERKINSVRKGGTQRGNGLADQLRKFIKEFDQIKKVDFFSSKTGSLLGRHISSFDSELKAMSSSAKPRPDVPVVKDIRDYQGKTWITRKNPYVDRMASAWLIRKFIDTRARFDLTDSQVTPGPRKENVTFDMMGGDFTHIGDLCTFEVLTRTFGIKDKTVKKIAELVHELDIKDGLYDNPESRGIEEVLSGIKKTTRNDSASLEQGMAIFEMLYASKI